MSATNVLIQSDRVHLITDGAHYLPDGTITAIGPKVRPLPHSNCAVAMRGSALAMPSILDEISAAATSFDFLRSGMPTLLQGCAVHHGHLLGLCNAGPDFEIVVAGISESDGPAAYLVASHDRYGDPWTTMPLAGFVALPCDHTILAGIQTITAGRNADEIDPAIDGLAVMEVQRAHPILERDKSGEEREVYSFLEIDKKLRARTSFHRYGFNGTKEQWDKLGLQDWSDNQIRPLVGYEHLFFSINDESRNRRAAEIISAYDAWKDELDAASIQSRMTEAEATVDRIDEEICDVTERMLKIEPKTLADFKALATALRLHCWDNDLDNGDTHEDRLINLMVKSLTEDRVQA